MAAQIEQTPTQLSSATGAAPTFQTGASHGSRMLFIDNLRILLISMVLVVHLDDTYGAIGSWDYHDPATNLLTGVLLTIPNAVGMASGMGFFFLLAGYFTPGPYDRKGPRSFLRDRLVRLGIPLLLYDLLLHPLVVYIGSGLHGSYWSFYGNYLLQMRGVTGVVWFLAVLLLFDLLYAAWRRMTRHRTQTTARTGKLPSYRAIFGFIFALGLIAYRRNWFFELTPKMGRDWSLIALMATLIILGGLVFPSVMQEAGASGTRQAGYAVAGGFNWLALSYALWESFVVVGVCIGLLVLFRMRWNHQGRLARSLAASVYTVYLIHAPVLVGFAYAFHVVELYPLLKFGIAVLITIPLCFLISSSIRKLPLANRML